MIAQQAVYLGLVTILLTHMFFVPEPPPLDGLPRPKRLYYRRRLAILSFFLGTLLNVYTVFFFKSSSLLVSFSFMLVMIGLLLLNEFDPFRRLGVAFRFALLSLCGLSFCATVVPMVFGRVGTLVFLVSMATACVPMLALAAGVRRWAPDRYLAARQQMLVPFGVMLIVFLGAYVLRVIPPVPLSIPFIGVYHGVERTDAGYRLSHERALWRFWHHGDQHFEAQPGDKLYVFFRIFSPARFSDQVTMEWYWKPKGSGWKRQDGIPIAIVGGREEGFRGYGVKTNYQPGEWKVQVETTDGREIGRIYFDVENAPEAPRTFETVVQ